MCGLSKVYSNCLFAAMFMALQGRAKRVWLVSSHAWWVPAHIAIETRRGHILHFRYDQEQCPLWFVGRVHGIRRSRALDALHRQARQVLCCLPPGLFLVLSFLAIAALAIPWGVVWYAWPLACAAESAGVLIAKRRGNG